MGGRGRSREEGKGRGREIGRSEDRNRGKVMKPGMGLDTGTGDEFG